MQHIVAFIQSHLQRPEFIFRRAAAYELDANFIHTYGESDRVGAVEEVTH